MLDKVALFSGLAQDALEALERHGVTKRYRRNTVIVEKGNYIAIEDKRVVINRKLPARG